MLKLFSKKLVVVSGQENCVVLWVQVEQENQHCLIFFPDISEYTVLPNLFIKTPSLISLVNQFIQLLNYTTKGHLHNNFYSTWEKIKVLVLTYHRSWILRWYFIFFNLWTFKTLLSNTRGIYYYLSKCTERISFVSKL